MSRSGFAMASKKWAGRGEPRQRKTGKGQAVALAGGWRCKDLYIGLSVLGSVEHSCDQILK